MRRSPAPRPRSRPALSWSPAERSTPPRYCCVRPTTTTRPGLRNSSAQVGRNYMVHNNSIMVGINPLRRNTSVFQKTLYFNDFYLRGTPDHPYPLGHVQLIGKLQGAMIKGQQPRRAPMWALNMATRRSIDWWLFSEDLPVPDNRVTLRRRRATSRSPGRRTTSAPTRCLSVKRSQAGPQNRIPDRVHRTTGIEVNSHQAGTVRAGVDPGIVGARSGLPLPTTSTTSSSWIPRSSRRCPS